MNSLLEQAATQTQHERHGRYPQANSVEDFRRNLSAVQQRIADACRRVGRPLRAGGEV